MAYAQKLQQLKHEISIIGKKIKGNFKSHQKKMIKFINGVTNKVEFEVLGKTIILEKGDSKKGFKHILEKHYGPNDLETMDILNLPMMFKKDAIKMANHGVSNNALTAYKRLKNQKEHRLIVDETKSNKLVVTTYRKT